MEDVLADYLSKKAEVYSLWENFELLDEKHRRQALKFLDGFFEIIENPKRTEKEIISKMRNGENIERVITTRVEELKR